MDLTARLTDAPVEVSRQTLGRGRRKRCRLNAAGFLDRHNVKHLVDRDAQRAEE